MAAFLGHLVSSGNPRARLVFTGGLLEPEIVMARKTPGKRLHPYRQGGKPKGDAVPVAQPSQPPQNESWLPGRKGQGGEGLSEGYGGSGGRGTGPSGPDDNKDTEDDH